MRIHEILIEGKRIPRKKGQKRKSKKHSDLYTDEDPKGTIHGLGFKDEATARSSVSKIRKSGRSHAHTKYKRQLQWSKGPKRQARQVRRQYIENL